MNNLLEEWEKRMWAYREEADKAKNDISRVKYMHKFMTLRDCIKELRYLNKK